MKLGLKCKHADKACHHLRLPVLAVQVDSNNYVGTVPALEMTTALLRVGTREFATTCIELLKTYSS